MRGKIPKKMVMHAAFWTPNEFAAAYVITIVNIKAGNVSMAEYPLTMWEEMLWGTKRLLDHGAKFEAIEIDNDGELTYLRSDPVPGSFPVTTYHNKKGLWWICDRAVKFCEDKIPWMKDEIDMLRAFRQHVAEVNRRRVQHRRDQNIH